MGSISAIELASHYQEQMWDLIIESGIASVVNMMTRRGFPMEFLGITDTEFPNLAKIRNITLPILIIHAEFDTLISPTESKDLFENAATKDKRLVVIPRSDHNSIMLWGIQQYFEAIRDFVYA